MADPPRCAHSVASDETAAFVHCGQGNARQNDQSVATWVNLPLLRRLSTLVYDSRTPWFSNMKHVIAPPTSSTEARLSSTRIKPREVSSRRLAAFRLNVGPMP